MLKYKFNKGEDGTLSLEEASVTIPEEARKCFQDMPKDKRPLEVGICSSDCDWSGYQLYVFTESENKMSQYRYIFSQYYTDILFHAGHKDECIRVIENMLAKLHNGLFFVKELPKEEREKLADICIEGHIMWAKPQSFGGRTRKNEEAVYEMIHRTRKVYCEAKGYRGEHERQDELMKKAAEAAKDRIRFEAFDRNGNMAEYVFSSPEKMLSMFHSDGIGLDGDAQIYKNRFYIGSHKYVAAVFSDIVKAVEYEYWKEKEICTEAEKADDTDLTDEDDMELEKE